MRDISLSIQYKSLMYVNVHKLIKDIVHLTCSYVTSSDNNKSGLFSQFRSRTDLS